MYFNARSLVRKVNDLKARISIEKPDLVLISETWTHQNIKNEELIIEDFDIISRDDRMDTKDGRGGGLLVYTKKNLTVHPLCIESDFNQITGVTCSNLSKQKLNIFLIYRSPNSTSQNDIILNEFLQHVPPNSILTGDFNFPCIRWDRLTGSSASGNFVEATQQAFLQQFVDFPTQQSGNILDLVLTNVPERILSVTAGMPLANSDHIAVFTEVKFNHTRTKVVQKKWNYERADWDKIYEKLNDAHWQDIKNENVESQWLHLLSIITEVHKNYVPMITQRRRTEPPWMTNDIRQMTRKKKRIWKEIKSTQSNQLSKDFKALQKRIRSEIRRKKFQYEADLSKNAKANKKKFYRYINTKTGKGSVGPITGEDGTYIEDDIKVAEALNTYFSSVFETAKSPLITPMDVNNEALSQITVTQQDIYDAIQALDWNSAPGPDEISSKFIKKMALSLVDPLHQIFHKSLESGQVPEGWKLANITPVHKSGSKTQVKNYRPISLTSTVCKLLEQIVKRHLLKHMQALGIIPSSQHGFVPNRSCTTNLVQFFEEVTGGVDKGFPVDVVYLDFQKAFDLVPHRTLIAKLHKNGIQGKLLAWIKEWLSGRKQRVTINRESSDRTFVESGVVQGSVLGPILFLIYVSDMSSVIKRPSFLGTYADDTKLGRAIQPGKNDHKALQSDINRLTEWCRENGMRFNVSKCKVIHFGHKNGRQQYEIDGTPLEAVESHKDLGILIQDNLKPSLHVASIVKKANAILGQVKRTFSFRKRETLVNIYTSFVRPHLENAAPFWNPWLHKDVKLIEGVQKRMIRMIPELNGSYEAKLKEIGLTSLEMRRERGDAIQVFKMLSGTDGIDWNDLFKPLLHEINTRSHAANNLKIPKANIDVRKFSFTIRAVKIWNKIPSQGRTCTTINQFKSWYDASRGGQLM